MHECAPTRQPGAFRLVLSVLVPFLLVQVTALAEEYEPRYNPGAAPQQPAGQPVPPGLGALLQGSAPQAQDASPAELGALVGQELRRQGDINEAASGLLNAFLGGEQEGPKPTIERVVVLEDSERRLLLRVTTANAAHASIYGRTRDHQAALQPQVAGYRYQVAPTSNDIDLTFALAEDVSPGTGFDSASLVLYLVRAGGSFARPDTVRTYLLPKRWESTIRVENVVVPIVFVPVGEVAQGSTPTARRYSPRVLSQLRLPTATPRYGTRGDEAEEYDVLWLGDTPPKAITQTRGARFQAAPPMMAQLALRTNLRPITAQRVYGLSKQNRDRRGNRSNRGKGPDLTKQRDLLNQVHVAESVRLELRGLTSIHSVVYEDRNPRANLYYYAPRAYYLAWSATDGHQMRMVYQASRADGEAGGVVMSARLRSGVDNRDVELMRQLLRAQLGNNQADLLPLPPAGPPTVSLGAELTALYDIAADQVTVQAGSDSNDDIQIAWRTDTLTKENIQVALLGDKGLAGNLHYRVDGADTGPGGIGAKLQIALADPATFGRIGWVRGQNWQNLTPYPARMRYMHALLIREVKTAGKPEKRPVVYSWSLGDAIVPPRGTARFDDRLVGSWVDSRALRTWIEYAVDGGCEACDEQVIAAITGGVSGVSASQLTFKTISPLDDTGAVELTVQVRTRYLHPTDREMGSMPEFVLDQDRSEFRAPVPVYLAGRQPGEARPGDPLFEYLISVTMADGQVYRANTWIPSDHLRVVIGSYQLRQALGFLPGNEAPGSTL